MTTCDYVIIGAGVMGLFTALNLLKRNKKVMVIDRSYIGDPKAASSGKTRSIRRDYNDPLYAQLATSAQKMWRDFEAEIGEEVYIQSGLINLAANDFCENGVETSYAAQSFNILEELDYGRAQFKGDQVNTAYEQFVADYASTDPTGGVLYLTTIREKMIELFFERGGQIYENTQVSAITLNEDGVEVVTQGDEDPINAEKIIICAGLGTQGLLDKISGLDAPQLPLIKQSPIEVRYFKVNDEIQEKYLSDNLPVMACLDIGIYGHPILEGKVDYVKLSHYAPLDIANLNNFKGSHVDLFVERFMPELAACESFPVNDTDQCSYDMVPDNDFIMGELEQERRIILGAGWNGTGYKFAPLIGQSLAALALGQNPGFDLSRFNPNRFSN